MHDRNNITGNLLWPVTCLAAVLIICAVTIMGHAVFGLNNLARKQSFESLESELLSTKASISRLTIDNAEWDESVNNLVLTRDQRWINRSLGVDMLENMQIDVVYIADENNSIWYMGSIVAEIDSLESIQDELIILFQKVRDGQNISDTANENYILIGDRLFLISAAAIVDQKLPDSPTLPDQPYSVMGFLQEIGAEELALLKEKLRFENLQFDTGELPGFESIALTAPSGREIGRLSWTPQAPGTMFFITMIPVAIAVVVFATICIYLIGRRTIAFSRKLIENEHFLEQKNRKLESSLEQLADANRRVKEASHAKTQFLANVSHELRTPLNAILGFSEIICEQRMGRIENQKYVEYAKDINESGAHLLSLINDILDLSKIQNGQFRLAPEQVDLVGIIESVAKLFSTQIRDQAIDFSTEHRSGGIIVMADERALRQILINLVGNALKFTPDRGRISVTTEIDKDKNIAVYIEDSGIGISEDQIEAVMTPFVQIENEFNQTKRGTGLGLPLSKQLMRLHDGDLTIKSKPGTGTTVTMLFPRKSLRTAPAHSKSQFQPALRTSRSS